MRKLSLLLALAALAGALYLLLQGAGADPGEAAPSAGSGPSQPDLPAPTGAAAATEAGRSAVAGDPQQGALRPPLILEIRTVALDGSGAVPDCALSLLDLAKIDPARLQQIAAAGSSLPPELLALGEAAVSDARGRLRRVHTGGPLLVVAHGRYLGIASWKPGQTGPIELAVAPRLDFAVQVVDAEGKPAAGVRVVLVAREDLGSSGAYWSLSRPPDGLASFPDFGLYYGSVRSQQASGFVSAVLARSETEWLSFPLDPLPEQPLVLRLPPAGEVVVQIVGDHGAARQCTLTAIPADERLPGFSAFRGLTAAVEDGQALFRHVPLGQRFRATLDLEGADGSASGDGDGPRSPGERRTLVVDLGDGVSFTGRLLRPDGAAADGRSWRYRLRSLSGSSHGGGLRLDPEGRFLIRLGPEQQGWELAALEIEAAPGWQRPAAAAERSSARAPLAGRYGPGEHQLGDLRLVPVPLLVAGRVVDPGGEPVAGAVLTVDLLELRNEDFGDTWRPLPDARQVSGEDGGFRIQADTGPGEFRLHAQRTGSYLGRPLLFAAGERELEVVLQQAGAIELPLLLPAGFGAEHLEVYAELSGDASRRWSGQPPFGKSEAAVVWSDLPPGSYDLELNLRGLEPPVERRAGVLVRPGETTRAAAADLRSRVYLLYISVSDEAGRGMSGEAQVGRVSLDGSGYRGGFRAVDERRFAVPALALAPRTYVVTAEGYRPALLSELSGDAAVVLSPLKPTRLRLPDPLPALEPGLDLRVSLRRKSDGLAASAFTPQMVALEGDLAPGAELVARFQASGSYQFFWTYSRQRDGATELLGALVSEFVLRDEDHGGSIEIPSPPDPR